jgi:hypothetical protein
VEALLTVLEGGELLITREVQVEAGGPPSESLLDLRPCGLHLTLPVVTPTCPWPLCLTSYQFYPKPQPRGETKPHLFFSMSIRLLVIEFESGRVHRQLLRKFL